MQKTYTITTQLGSLTTPIAKEAIKLALRNRINKITVTYENGISFTHIMKDYGLIIIHETRLKDDLENFENNFLPLISN